MHIYGYTCIHIIKCLFVCVFLERADITAIPGPSTPTDMQEFREVEVKDEPLDELSQFFEIFLEDFKEASSCETFAVEEEDPL